MERQEMLDPHVDAIAEAIKNFVREYVREEVQKLRDEQDQQIREILSGLTAEISAELK